MQPNDSRKRARRAPNGATTAERFWPWVDKNGPGGCWLWTGACQKAGHGFAGRQKGEPGSRLAHRIAWELLRGPLPEGVELRHLCDHTNCVNPDHLQPGSHAQNMADRRYRGSACLRIGRQPEPLPDPIVCVCHYCGNFFLSAPANVARGNARFCRRSCYNAFKSAPMEVRFWRAVKKSDSCWLWMKARTHFGYGALPRDGHGAGYVQAHRFSWELHFGPIPEGLLVLHRCDVPACVRPDHLFLGTHQDNIADKMAKGRQPRGDASSPRRYPETRPRGEGHKNSKLTEAAVLEIRRDALQPGGPSFGELARRFGVTPGRVADAFYRRTWKHLG